MRRPAQRFRRACGYLLCVGACIKVLLPHRLVFSFRGSILIETAREVQADLEETRW
jgi:hypothetical protein